MARKKAAFIEVFGAAAGNAAKTAAPLRRPTTLSGRSRKAASSKANVAKGTGRMGEGAAAASRSARLEPGCLAVRKDWLAAAVICVALLFVVAFAFGNAHGRRAMRQQLADATPDAGSGSARDADSATGERASLVVGGGTGRETPASPVMKVPPRFFSLRVIGGIPETSAKKVAADLRNEGADVVFSRPTRRGWAVYVGVFERSDDPRLAQLNDKLAKVEAFKDCYVVELRSSAPR